MILNEPDAFVTRSSDEARADDRIVPVPVPADVRSVDLMMVGVRTTAVEAVTSLAEVLLSGPADVEVALRAAVVVMRAVDLGRAEVVALEELTAAERETPGDDEGGGSALGRAETFDSRRAVTVKVTFSADADIAADAGLQAVVVTLPAVRLQGALPCAMEELNCMTGHPNTAEVS